MIFTILSLSLSSFISTFCSIKSSIKGDYETHPTKELIPGPEKAGNDSTKFKILRGTIWPKQVFVPYFRPARNSAFLVVWNTPRHDGFHSEQALLAILGQGQEQVRNNFERKSRWPILLRDGCGSTLTRLLTYLHTTTTTMKVGYGGLEWSLTHSLTHSIISFTMALKKAHS